MLRLYCQFFTTSRHPWMSELLSVCDIEQNRNISVSVQTSYSCCYFLMITIAPCGWTQGSDDDHIDDIDDKMERSLSKKHNLNETEFLQFYTLSATFRIPPQIEWLHKKPQQNMCTKHARRREASSACGWCWLVSCCWGSEKIK